MTQLPLVFAEGSVADIIHSAPPPPLLPGWQVIPVDTADEITAHRDLAILAQPRRLAADEMAELDHWLRGGGRLILFADPMLHWPSKLALGDPGRAPLVTLLDPLFTHWGLVMDDGVEGPAPLGIGAASTHGDGRWRNVQGGCHIEVPAVAVCRLGKGVAVLVADADVLRPTSGRDSTLTELIALTSGESRRAQIMPVLLGLGGVGALAAIIYRTLRSRK